MRISSISDRGLWIVGAAGFVCSLILLACSTGSNDIRTWQFFAAEIERIGVFELYRTNIVFNHPLLMGYLALLCLKVSSATGIAFPIVFKIVPVLSNLGAGFVLAAIWRARAGGRTAALAFALYGWSLCAILVGAYHGNTDSFCVFWCVLCIYLLEVQRRPGLAGLALAAAVNVKIIPALVVLPVLSSFRSRRDAIRFSAGLAVALVPFLIALLGTGTTMLRNVFQYGSNLELWGPYVVIALFDAIPGVTPEDVIRIGGAYHDHWGKWVVIGATLALSAYGFRKRLDPARMMAASFALFLAVAPGFGVQYTVYLAPIAFAVSLKWGVRYSLIAGVFIGLVYLNFLIDAFPLESRHRSYPFSIGFVGFAAWLTILGLLRACLRDAGAGAGTVQGERDL